MLTRFALIPGAVLAGVLGVGWRDVTQAIVMLTVAVHGAAFITICLVDALKVNGAVRPGTLIKALIIRATLRPRHLVVTNLETIKCEAQVRARVRVQIINKTNFQLCFIF